MSREKENKELKKLASINEDACAFYNKASEEAGDMNIKRTFRNLEDIHNNVVINLQKCMRQNGGDPEVDETVVGKTAQFWGTLMSKISNDVDETLVSHLEEAEDRCIHSMEKCLESEDLSAPIKSVLATELQSLRKSHDYMKALKETMKAA